MTSTDFDPATAVLDDITGDYTIDTAHSRLGFVARHAMVTKVRGEFAEFTGTAHIDTANPADSKVEVTHRRRQRQHRQRASATATSLGGLLRHRALPRDHLRLDRGQPATATSGRSPAT